MARVLVVKIGAIGDVIVTLPAVIALHERGDEVDWVCGSVAAPLLQLYPWIRVVEVNERKLLRGSIAEQLGEGLRLWRRIAGRRYDLCATLYYDARYRLLTLPVRASKKIRLSRSDRRYAMVAGRSRASEILRILLQREDSWTTGEARPARLSGGDEQGLGRPERRVTLVPGGARNLLRDDGLRRWPVESYVALAERLIAAGVSVALSGGRDDVWTLPFFAHCAESLEVHFGDLSLLDSLVDLDRASVVVSHDTGPLHMTGMTRAAIVAIFGPTDPHVVMPMRENVLALWGGADLACRPCYDGKNFAPCRRNGCMADISVDFVEREVLGLLAAAQAGVMHDSRIQHC